MKCAHCGVEFDTNRSDQKYCSDDCFNANIKKIQAMALAQEKAKALNNKAVSLEVEVIGHIAEEDYLETYNPQI